MGWVNAKGIGDEYDIYTVFVLHYLSGMTSSSNGEPFGKEQYLLSVASGG